MLARLAGFVLRRRRAVLAGTAALALVGAAAGATLFGKLTTGGFDDPSSESGRADAYLARVFTQGAPNLTLLVTTARGVDDPSASAEGTALTRQLAAEPGVVGVTSYWTSGRAPRLRGKNGDKALILATIAGDETAVDKRFTGLLPRYQGVHDGLDVQAGGFAALEHVINVQGQKDAETGEAIAFPLTLVALVLIFGSVVAALLPLAVALVTMLLTMGFMWILASVTGLSSLSAGVVSLLGLGLAIDYSLLMVSRYREELRAGRPPADAITATMRSAGRTVAFSAVTVAAASSGMVWFPLQAVRSVGYAGMATAVLAAVTSLTLLPAVFAVLGPRIERGRLIRRRAVTAAAGENGSWHRLATFVMRRPVPIATAVTAVLLLLGTPFLGIRLGMPDERVLPAASVPRQVAATINAEFGTSQENAIQIVVPPAAAAYPDAVASYAVTLSRLPDVAQVATVTGSYARGARLAPASAQDRNFAAGGAVYLSVVPASGSLDSAQRLVTGIRAVPAPFRTLVGGIPALNLDAAIAVEHRLPYALTSVAAIMVVLLFLVTGSVVLPFLALVLSALSLTATFGALVWIFQDGHLSWLLGGFTTSGSIAVTVPVMLFALSYGLVMDYQVFLLSRIREEYERTGSGTGAVAMGLERIGRIVTAAAVLISIVFLAFLVSGIALDKTFGIGLPLAVLLDATLIRGALLPAAMRLGGRGTWWAPGPLRQLHARFGLRENAKDVPGTRSRVAVE